MPNIAWNGVQGVATVQYDCGHCGRAVASDKGWNGRLALGNHGVEVRIRICPNCMEPTYFRITEQIPGAAYGEQVGHLPPNVERLYNEARNSTSVQSYTAAVMVCRKLLASVAVGLGAREGESFQNYVTWLEDNGHTPPKARAWVNRIRDKGNEANHEIALMGEADAKQMITFLAMLLRLTFEFPGQLGQNQSG